MNYEARQLDVTKLSVVYVHLYARLTVFIMKINLRSHRQNQCFHVCVCVCVYVYVCVFACVCVCVSDPHFIRFSLDSCYAVHVSALSIELKCTSKGTTCKSN